MGKKSKRSKASETSTSAGSRPAPALRSKEAEVETKDNLRFEDPFVDEVEEDDIIEDINDDDEEEAMVYDENGNREIVQSWNPLTGEALAPGQELEMDASAYKMHHALNPEWPSLSFDFLRDDLGESRTRFPHTLTAVVGTQAGRREDNQLTVMKLSDLARILVETEDDILGEEYNPDKEDDDDDSDDEDQLDVDPVLESFSVRHDGGVNRIRSMPQQANMVATWSDVGAVNVFNLDSIVSKFSQKNAKASAPASELKPVFVHSQHPTEGYALDWSPVKQGHLASGDCAGNIHIWTPRPEGGFEVVPSYESKVYSAGQSAEHPSVEDIQWSPSEATVFCTAECGGYVRIFDTRAPNRAMLSHKIQSDGADVNVVSWNTLVTNLLACGGDDGVLSVWDLRHFSATVPDPLARFTTHKTPITSVEWHPTDESMLAASDDVGTYIYDLSVEEDDNKGELDVPPQLLFVHCGSEQFKEVHWHPQISSCLMTTALSGFSVFIPSNL